MALNNKRFKIRLKRKNPLESALELQNRELDSLEVKPAKRRLFGRSNKQYKKVLVIAHRGFSGVAPENTLSAFKKAIDSGADMIEFDVSLSKDGIPVVIHDSTINRTTNGKGKVADYTFAELKKFDAGSWYKPEFCDERIPSLEEVVKLAKDKIMLNIEIKSYSVKKGNSSEGVEDKIVKIIEKYGMVNQILISSFSKLAVERIKELSPDIPVALLHRFGINKSLIKNFDNVGIYSFNQGKRFFSKKAMKQIHKAGIKLNLYTVNQKREMKRFVKIGVDGIITNFPDKLIEVMDELLI